MLGWARNTKNYVKDLVDKCMHEPEVNSRLIFLGTFVVTSVIMLAHAAVYLWSKAKDPNYTTILTVLLGGHGVNAFGRFMTKKSESGSTPDPQQQPPQQQP